MRRKLFLIAGLFLLFLPLGAGCNTREPVIWSWPHNKRRILKIADGFHQFHMDFDRIIFDMEEYPLEPDYY